MVTTHANVIGAFLWVVVNPYTWYRTQWKGVVSAPDIGGGRWNYIIHRGTPSVVLQ
jgi:hypothetical protein